jgi:hypothetical protein
MRFLKGKRLLFKDSVWQERSDIIFLCATYYKAFFCAKKDDIAIENTFFWDIKFE